MSIAEKVVTSVSTHGAPARVSSFLFLIGSDMADNYRLVRNAVSFKKEKE